MSKEIIFSKSIKYLPLICRQFKAESVILTTEVLAAKFKSEPAILTGLKYLTNAEEVRVFMKEKSNTIQNVFALGEVSDALILLMLDWEEEKPLRLILDSTQENPAINYHPKATQLFSRFLVRESKYVTPAASYIIGDCPVGLIHHLSPEAYSIFICDLTTVDAVKALEKKTHIKCINLTNATADVVRHIPGNITFVGINFSTTEYTLKALNEIKNSETITVFDENENLITRIPPKPAVNIPLTRQFPSSSSSLVTNSSSASTAHTLFTDNEAVPSVQVNNAPNFAFNPISLLNTNTTSSLDSTLSVTILDQASFEKCVPIGKLTTVNQVKDLWAKKDITTITLFDPDPLVLKEIPPHITNVILTQFATEEMVKALWEITNIRFMFIRNARVNAIKHIPEHIKDIIIDEVISPDSLKALEEKKNITTIHILRASGDILKCIPSHFTKVVIYSPPPHKDVLDALHEIKNSEIVRVFDKDGFIIDSIFPKPDKNIPLAAVNNAPNFSFNPNSNFTNFGAFEKLQAESDFKRFLIDENEKSVFINRSTTEEAIRDLWGKKVTSHTLGSPAPVVAKNIPPHIKKVIIHSFTTEDAVKALEGKTHIRFIHIKDVSANVIKHIPEHITDVVIDFMTNPKAIKALEEKKNVKTIHILGGFDIHIPSHITKVIIYPPDLCRNVRESVLTGLHKINNSETITVYNKKGEVIDRIDPKPTVNTPLVPETKVLPLSSSETFGQTSFNTNLPLSFENTENLPPTMHPYAIPLPTSTIPPVTSTFTSPLNNAITLPSLASSTSTTLSSLLYANDNAQFLDAAKKGDINKVKECLDSKVVDIDNRRNNIGGFHTALMWAAHNGHIRIVELLLERGAKVDCKLAGPQLSALHFATKEGHFDIVKILVTHGASVFAKNNSGQTPYMLANKIKRVDIANYLKMQEQEKSLKRKAKTELKSQPPSKKYIVLP